MPQLALESFSMVQRLWLLTTFMTLLHATSNEWTDFAKPVIFSEGLIVLAQIFHILRFCLLTNGPQQSTRMVCHPSTSVCCDLCYALFSSFFFLLCCEIRKSYWLGRCSIKRAAFLLIHRPLSDSCPACRLMDSTVSCQYRFERKPHSASSCER